MARKITGFMACMLAIMLITPPAAADGSKAAPAISSVIDGYVEREMKTGDIPGLSISIVEGNEITYLRGYGEADTKGTPVTAQTAFTICSVGKVITALAIRQLANEGKIDYDAPVQKYIPWFRLADAQASAEIKISQLVAHTSGISKADGEAAYTYNAKYSIEQVVRKLANVKPDRPVGQSFEYSNMNFIILGLVVEKVSGQTYEQYVQQNILDPLGMKNSYLSPGTAGHASLAMGHGVAFGVTVPANIPFPPAQSPAGYQLISAEDMARFVSLYISNGYVDGKSIIPNNPLPELKPPYAAFTMEEKRYDEYWMEDQGIAQGDGGYYGHVGGSSCFSTVMLINPLLKKGIVVLANCQNNTITAQTIGNGIAQILNTGAMPAEPSPAGKRNYASTLAALVLMALIILRAFWARRFGRSVSAGKVRRVLALVSFALVDAAVPLAILAGIPLGFDMTWRFYIAANLELALLLLLAAAGLGAIGIAKVIMLIRHHPAKKALPV